MLIDRLQRMTPVDPQKLSLLAGALCVLLAGTWQFAIVHFGFQGNWTGLFMTGGLTRVPPQLAGEHIYEFENSTGYDGQYYHYVAHDPFNTKGLSEYIDVPQLRYQRILVPMAAYLLAGGSDEHIDAAYFAVVLIFVFLGGYWVSRYAIAHHRSAWFALAFLLVPGVFISLERMTVEVALAALTAGFAWYTMEGPDWKLYLVMAAAFLTRETGLFLAAGYVMYCLSRKELFRAVAFGSSALPGFLWIRSVSRQGNRLPVPVRWNRLIRIPGILEKFWRPQSYPFAGARLLALRVADYVGWIGVVLLGVQTVKYARRHPGPVELVGVISIVPALLIGNGNFWYHPVAYARPITPVFVLMGLKAITDRSWLLAISILMVDARLYTDWIPRIWTVLGGP